MSLLPSSRPEVTAEQRGDFRVLGFDEDATDAAFEALSSGSARRILGRLHEEPHTQSELAEAIDTSLQNVSYHLEKLAAADLVRVAGTQYSEKGREMKVYAPADEPLVVFVGSDDRKSGLKRLLERFVGATGVLAAASILVHTLVEGDLPFVSFTGAAGGGGGVTPGVPVATAFFLGGLASLVLVSLWWYWTDEPARTSPRIVDRPLLGGRDPAVSRRFVIGAGAAAIALLALWGVVTSLDVVIPAVGPVGPFQALVIVLAAAAALQAYVNDGLFVSWLVVFAPLAALGFGSFGVGLAGAGPDRIPGIIGYPVLLGAVGGLLLGSAGFLVGAGARRIVSRLGRGSRK